MQQPQPEKSIVLTPEQLASAPEAVRRWLLDTCGDIEAAERGFVLDRHGNQTSGDGLAICEMLEIKHLLHALSEDFQSCQILFELGCDYYNPQTGQRRGHIVRLTDFLHRTDARNLTEVERGLHAINLALGHLRHDPEATIYRPDGHGNFHVHEITQHAIYQIWRRLFRLIATRRRKTAPAVGQVILGRDEVA